MKKSDKYLFLSLLICFISIVIMFAALFSGEPQIQMEFTPPPFEESAEKGIPNVPGNLGWDELNASAFKVSVCGKVFFENEKAVVWFTNPDENTLWLKLRIIDSEGDIIGETGIIRPGEYIKDVSLSGEISDGMPIILKVMSYEPETYYSAGAISLNTVIKASS